MSRIFALILLGLTLTGRAEPLVVGYERFHAAQPDALGGRLLYNELGCANCHGNPAGLPERRGPELAGVTTRVQAEWLVAFLSNPASLRAGTQMPHVLSAGKPGDAEAVVHYLAGLKPKGAAPKASRHVNAERGKELYHSLGCVACHAPSKDFRPPEGAPKAEDYSHPSVEFPSLSSKYALVNLTAFLQNPLQFRKDGRMPKIEMEPQDAADLAGFLLEFGGSDGVDAPVIAPFVADPAKAALGREIVHAARCASCHDLPKDVFSPVVPLRNVNGGCVAEKPAAGLPWYGLIEGQRSSLQAFLKQKDQAPSELELAGLALESLNCVACHERNGRGGPDLARKAFFQGDHNLGDTGRYPPPLTGIGRKLQPEWFHDVLEGKARVRPYLQTKMPVYGAATVGLAERLGKVDARVEAALPGGDDTAGRKLMGTLGGLGCITCHRYGEHASLGIQALDLSNIGQRLQPGWLAEYLVHPAGYRPGTLMPSFWPGGTAANREILAGDTMRQIASIYSFAKSANGEPEGFPATTGGEFELVPKDTPIVQRTFMEGVGTHAILVGFPQGIHLAYDGLGGGPKMAWRGRFFDAYNTWFSRFAPFEKVLGESALKWPKASSDVVFLGYQLDAKRVPVFLLKVGGRPVSERFEPVEGGLRRTLRGEASVLKGLQLAPPEGASAREETATSPEMRSIVYLWN